MDERQELDVESIVQHIRENLRHGRMASPPEDGQLSTALAELRCNHDIYHIHFTSHRRGFGWLIVLIKKLVRQLLTPSLERQVAYNSTNMRISSQLWERLQETRVQLQETCERQAMLQSKIEILPYQQGQLQEIRAQLQEIRARLQETCERQTMLQSKIAVLPYQQGQHRE